MNINDWDKSHSLKDTRTITKVHFQETDLTKGFNHSRGPLVIKKSTGTGVPLSRFTAFFRLVEFTDLNALAARTDTAAGINFWTCALTARISHWSYPSAHLVFHGKPNIFITLLTLRGMMLEDPGYSGSESL